MHKSCLTDHANTHNHVINWKDIGVKDQDDGSAKERNKRNHTNMNDVEQHEQGT